MSVNQNPVVAIATTSSLLVKQGCISCDFQEVLESESFEDVAISHMGDKIVALTNDGNIYHGGIDSGGQFYFQRDVNAPPVLWKSVCASSNFDIIVAVARGSYIYYTYDQGGSWNSFGNPYAWADVDCSSDGSLIVAAVQSGNIWISGLSAPTCKYSSIDNLRFAVDSYLNNEESMSCPDIGDWDVSEITNMSHLFAFRSSRRIGSKLDNITRWDVSRVIDMQFMFTNIYDFDPPRLDWDVSSCRNFSNMFARTNLSNADYLEHWNVSNGENFAYMFDSIGQVEVTYNQNGEFSFWSTLTDFSQFQADLSRWNVERGSSFLNMFRGCSKFTSDLSTWSTHPLDITGMFAGAFHFNSNLNNFDTSDVISLNSTFHSAYVTLPLA